MALYQLLRITILLAFLALVAGCGGTKTLAPDEYNALSAEQRIEYLKGQVAKKPDDIPLRRQLYQEYLNADLRPEALAEMEQILAQDPYQTDVQFTYGEMQYKGGNYQEAYRAFRSVLQSNDGPTYRDQVASYIAGGYMVQQVTNDPADEGFPVFSPDGTRILFQRRVGDNWDVMEMDLADQSVSTVVGTPADEELAVYAPDGSAITYASNESDRRPIDPRYQVREIMQMQLSDRYTRSLTLSVADDWRPSYSHDGQYILFVSERGDLRRVKYTEKQSDVFIMEADGDFQLQLTEAGFNEGGAVFSIDDRRVFFHSNRNGSYDIMVMKPDGSQQMTVVDNTSGDDINPSASPDSAHIAFVSDRDGNFEIYRAAIDGSLEERLTFSPAIDSNPSFSPDGNTIAFHSNRSGNYDVFLLNLAYPSGTLTMADLLDRLNRMIN